MAEAGLSCRIEPIATSAYPTPAARPLNSRLDGGSLQRAYGIEQPDWRAGLRDVVAAELWLREPTDPARLNGCGLLVVNPPWGFEADAGAVLAALLDRLGAGEPGQGWTVTRVVEE